ncbi:MAG: response regulator [Candidatus Binatia bacterium]
MREKLLLVEDDADLMEVMTIFLTLRGYKVLKGRNGAEALEIAASQLPDLIILDIFLPGMDGFQVASKIRKNPKIRHVPILAVTGRELSDIRARKAFDGYVTKPSDLNLLEAKIEELLK